MSHQHRIQVIDWYAEGYHDGKQGTPRFDPFTADLDTLDARAYLRGFKDGQASQQGYCEFCGSGPTCAVCRRGLTAAV